jgi:hypothetical protein
MSDILDSAGSIFFQRQLDYIKKQVYETLYAPRKAWQLIPMSYEANPGATAITYEMFTQVGLAQWLANYADDLPRVDVVGQDFTSFVRTFGMAYGFSTKDIRSAQMQAQSESSPNKVYLPMIKANAARLAYEQFMNKIAWLGAPEYGLYGLTNHPNIPSGAVPADGTGGATTFVSKTALQIVRDMNAAVNAIVSLTDGVEIPNTLIMPIAQYTYIRSTPFSSLNTDSILTYFLANNPEIKTVDWVPELKGAGPGGTDMMIAYDKNIMKFWMENPLPFTQYAVERRNLEYVVPCEASTAGIIIPYPLSANIAYGI